MVGYFSLPLMLWIDRLVLQRARAPDRRDGQIGIDALELQPAVPDVAIGIERQSDRDLKGDEAKDECGAEDEPQQSPAGGCCCRAPGGRP